MTYTLGSSVKPKFSSTRQRLSSVSFEGVESITKHDYDLQKQHKEGQMRSLDLQIIDNNLLAKSWDVAASGEKVKQRQIGYNIESTNTDIADVKQLIADVNYEQEQTRLSLAQEKHSQLEDRLLFEQASSIQEREMMTIQGNTRHLQIEESRLNLTQLEASLKSRYAADFDVLDAIPIFIEDSTGLT
ncbi:hypothetical protein [Okeania sp. SIO2B3]|uniref:hypothetical protein n=1 Tax=Okeania sp. SIO2B3 TaxID=2607784 RepID=UPI0013C1B39D|nr:hypothetical protein [Okeania sp. SIO2B3]NET47096.1 hypothetical protein [Okeania sp. SIO2B3]